MALAVCTPGPRRATRAHAPRHTRGREHVRRPPGFAGGLDLAMLTLLSGIPDTVFLWATRSVRLSIVAAKVPIAPVITSPVVVSMLARSPAAARLALTISGFPAPLEPFAFNNPRQRRRSEPGDLLPPHATQKPSWTSMATRSLAPSDSFATRPAGTTQGQGDQSHRHAGEQRAARRGRRTGAARTSKLLHAPSSRGRSKAGNTCEARQAIGECAER